MNFGPWWRADRFRGKLEGLGLGLMAWPVLAVVVSWLLFPQRRGELAAIGPVEMAAFGVGIVLLALALSLRPRSHHAQVLYVEMPDVRPYYYSICECRWFGGVTDEAETAFRAARKHTDAVDDEVVRAFERA